MSERETVHSSTMQRLHPTPASNLARLLGNVETALVPWDPPAPARFWVWCFAPILALAEPGTPVWSPADFPTVEQANEAVTQMRRSEWAPGIRCRAYVELVTDSKLARDRLDQTSRSRRFAPSAPTRRNGK